MWWQMFDGSLERDTEIFQTLLFLTEDKQNVQSC